MPGAAFVRVTRSALVEEEMVAWGEPQETLSAVARNWRERPS